MVHKTIPDSSSSQIEKKMTVAISSLDSRRWRIGDKRQIVEKTNRILKLVNSFLESNALARKPDSVIIRKLKKELEKELRKLKDEIKELRSKERKQKSKVMKLILGKVADSAGEATSEIISQYPQFIVSKNIDRKKNSVCFEFKLKGSVELSQTVLVNATRYARTRNLIIDYVGTLIQNEVRIIKLDAIASMLREYLGSDFLHGAVLSKVRIILSEANSTSGNKFLVWTADSKIMDKVNVQWRKGSGDFLTFVLPKKMDQIMVNDTNFGNDLSAAIEHSTEKIRQARAYIG